MRTAIATGGGAVVLIAIGVAALGVGFWPYARARFSAGPGIS
jgi:hypothetical protein